MGTFLQEIFFRFGGAFLSWETEDELEPSCVGILSEAIEYVVNQTDVRLRCLPGYSKRLRAPVAATFRYVDELVNGVPGAISCCRSTFSNDPRVSAFFVDPRHLQEVFSQSAQVRDLLEVNPEVAECWALLCMRKDERQRLGMSLVGDAVHRDVMQTAVSFTDHQVLASGSSEADARRSLKCCIFKGLLGHIGKQVGDAKTRVMQLDIRRKSLHRRRMKAASEEEAKSQDELQAKIDEMERELAQGIPRLLCLEDHMDFVVDVLRSPDQYLSGRACSIRLSRLGIKLEGEPAGAGNEIPLYVIQVASHGPRVGALVRFPRTELLPPQDFVRRADLFLTL